jgi:DNA-directed RNA polymerase specialized sigma24 family protein
VLGHVSGPKGCICNQQKRIPLEAAEEARIEHVDKLYQDQILANEIRAQADARSSKFAEVMRLYIEEGYTMEEIAMQLGESPAKIRSMYYRNLSYLQELFRDDRDDDDDDPVEH